MVFGPAPPENTKHQAEDGNKNTGDHNYHQVIQVFDIPAGSEAELVEPVKKAFKFRLGTMKHKKDKDKNSP